MANETSLPRDAVVRLAQCAGKSGPRTSRRLVGGAEREHGHEDLDSPDCAGIVLRRGGRDSGSGCRRRPGRWWRIWRWQRWPFAWRRSRFVGGRLSRRVERRLPRRHFRLPRRPSHGAWRWLRRVPRKHWGRPARGVLAELRGGQLLWLRERRGQHQPGHVRRRVYGKHAGLSQLFGACGTTRLRVGRPPRLRQLEREFRAAGGFSHRWNRTGAALRVAGCDRSRADRGEHEACLSRIAGNGARREQRAERCARRLRQLQRQSGRRQPEFPVVQQQLSSGQRRGLGSRQ